MEIGPYGIPAFQCIGYTVNRLLLLFLESAKHPVKDYECGAIVFIQVFLIPGMMYTVVRRSGKDIFNRLWQFPDVFSMNPELIKHFNLVADKEYKRMKAQ